VYYYSKTDLAKDINRDYTQRILTGDLAGDLVGDIVAKNSNIAERPTSSETSLEILYQKCCTIGAKSKNNCSKKEYTIVASHCFDFTE
jgi:hypothetical protein